jgi:hypothetical protein
MAMFSRITSLDMAMLFSGWTVLGGFVLALSFYALAKRFAPGRWVPLVGAGAYLVFNQFMDFRALGYPNRLSLGLLFFGILAFVELFEKPSWTAAAAVGAAGVAISAMHVGNAEFFFIAGAAIAFWALVDAIVGKWRDGEWAFDGFLALAGALAAVAVVSLPFILPKLGVVGESSMVDTASAVTRLDLMQLGPWVITRPGRFFDGGTLPFVMTTALALFMAGWSMVKRDRVSLSAFAICSLPVLLLVDPPLTTFLVTRSFYNLARIAALLGFTLYIAIAWALSRPKKAAGRSQAVFLAVIALVGAAVISVGFLQTTWTESVGAVRKGMNVSVWANREADVRVLWGEDTLARIRQRFDGTVPMIASDPETGYYFSGLVDVNLVCAPRSHSPLAIELVSGPARRDAMARLMFPSASVEERRAILTKWGADYVLISRSPVNPASAADSMMLQPELFQPVDVTPRLVLFKVLR